MFDTDSPQESQRKRARIERGTLMPATKVHRRNGSNGSISAVSSLGYNDATETALKRGEYLKIIGLDERFVDDGEIECKSFATTDHFDPTAARFEKCIPAGSFSPSVEFLENCPEALVVLPNE
jgi:hypothetical protein